MILLWEKNINEIKADFLRKLRSMGRQGNFKDTQKEIDSIIRGLKTRMDMTNMEPEIRKARGILDKMLSL